MEHVRCLLSWCLCFPRLIFKKLPHTVWAGIPLPVIRGLSLPILVMAVPKVVQGITPGPSFSIGMALISPSNFVSLLSVAVSNSFASLHILPLSDLRRKVADTHMHDTRTGAKKGTFRAFYSEARKKACTKKNIGSAWKKTCICPFNPDEVLENLVSVEIEKAPPPQSFTHLRTAANFVSGLAAVKQVTKGDSLKEDTI